MFCITDCLKKPRFCPALRSPNVTNLKGGSSTHLVIYLILEFWNRINHVIFRVFRLNPYLSFSRNYLLFYNMFQSRTCFVSGNVNMKFEERNWNFKIIFKWNYMFSFKWKYSPLYNKFINVEYIILEKLFKRLFIFLQILPILIFHFYMIVQF